MKVAILGAVHGTSEKDRLIFETYKAAVSLKYEDATIITSKVIFKHKDDFKAANPKATEEEVLADMVSFDLNEVKTSDMVLADVSLRSIGVGLELAQLTNSKARLILFCKSDCTYSDMVKGAFPNSKVYKYDNADTLAEILNEIL